MADASGFELVARLVVSLGVVLALMVGAAALLRRRALPGASRRRPAPIEVLGRQGLGRNASIAVVRAGGRSLVLGVTETSVRLLAEADPEALAEDGTATERTALPGSGPVRSGTPGAGLIDVVREWTVRRS